MPRWLDWLLRRPRRPAPEDYPAGPVRALAEVYVEDETVLDDVEFLAIDLETTGLDPRTDHVVAIGWLPMRRGEMVLGGTRQALVRPPAGVTVGESATIHGLTDDVLADAPPLADVLPAFLADLRGRVLVAHHAPFDVGFLTRAVEQVYGCGLPATSVDTLALQRRLVPLVDPPRGTYRLDSARRHHGLPTYRAHGAAIDALAAGELLLAQVAMLAHDRHQPLRLTDLGPTRAR